MEVINVGEVINYDEQINKGGGSIHVSNSFLAPSQPCRCAIVGPGGSGKSNHFLDLLLRWMKWNRVYLFCKNEKEDKAIFLQKKMEVFQAALDKKLGDKSYNIYSVSTDLKDLPDLNDMVSESKDFHTIVIINDLVLEKNQENLAQFFIRSRHMNVSILYCTQFYFSMPKVMRDSCTDIHVFKFADNRNIAKLANIYSRGISKQKFIELYHEATKDRYSWFNIDLRAKSMLLKYRRRFNGLYVEKSEDK